MYGIMGERKKSSEFWPDVRSAVLRRAMIPRVSSFFRRPDRGEVFTDTSICKTAACVHPVHPSKDPLNFERNSWAV